MTFLQIVNAVLSDRFKEAQRPDAQNWVNHRYAWLWAIEDWTFKQATATVNVTAGSRTVTGLPPDLGTVMALIRADGTELDYMEPERFYPYYNSATQTTDLGTPDTFTVVSGAVFVGPYSNETAAYTLVYEREPTLLAGDNDVPAIPAGFHFALVHGGAAEGLKLQNDPTWQAFEQDFKASIDVMRAQYLTNQRWSHGQVGRWTYEEVGVRL